MGMQYRCKAWYALEFFVVFSKCFQDVLDAVKHQGIDFFLISLSKPPALPGDS